MKTIKKSSWLNLCLIAAIVFNGMIVPVRAQQIDVTSQITQEITAQDGNQIFVNLLRQAQNGESAVLIEKIFGSETQEAADVFGENSEQLFQSVNESAGQRAEERLDEKIKERSEKKTSAPIIAPVEKTNPVQRKTVKKDAPKSKKIGFIYQPKTDWRQFAFGFQPFRREDEKPDIKMTETDKEIKAEGVDKKSFETKEARGTRTQKAETRYIKDGKTFGVEIKNTQIIEAVSKPEGKIFRQEISITWGAEVAACPDVNGVSAGTGKTKVISKTIYTENGETVTITNDFDIQAKIKGFVNDQAELKNYDFEADAYLTSSGGEDALRRNIVKELKIKDGKYGLRIEIPGNTIEISDGTYGGQRTPAQMGKISGRNLTTIPAADSETIGKSIGSMIPAIWNSANDMYKSAERNWKNFGCVEVQCKVPKTTLEPGEEVSISTETVHLQDNSKINANLTAEAYPGQISPENQTGKPGATFIFTQEGEENSYFSVKSVSKRGIGKGDIDFQVKKEKEETQISAGVWTGFISVQRKRREDREKRAGANLAENGGNMETLTDVKFQLTGRLDRSVDATNAYIALVSGKQVTIDYEYDKYKIDEGYCGPNAVPYKGPKEITRTSTTTVNYTKETRVFLEIGTTGGSATFSLPEQTGRAVHKYVHKSPCAEHDRANTSEAIDEEALTAGGSFSFSFPIDPTQKTTKGTISVREEDGSTTVYSWELSKL